MKRLIFISSDCPSHAEWRALLDRELPESRVTEMACHLDGCLTCPKVIESLTPALPRGVIDVFREGVASLPGGGPRRVWPDAYLPARDHEPAGDVDESPPPFDRAGDYVLGAKLGQGGMGVVYRATDVRLEIDVALKMPSRRSRRPAAAWERLGKEAKRLAALNHPNVVRVFAAGEEAGVPYFTMELIEGPTLDKVVSGVPLRPREAARLVETIAAAVDYAHGKGVYHLDLKPANIFLARGDEVKVGDFGLARALRDATHDQGLRGAGTDIYMAPEQWMGDRGDLRERTDVYGLGAILYELLTGRPPFLRSECRNETRRRVLFDRPIAPRTLRGEVERDLETICLRCLEKSPESRYVSAGEVAVALGRFRAGFPIGPCSPAKAALYLVRRRKATVAAACVGLLSFLAVLGALLVVRWNHLVATAMSRTDQARALTTEGRLAEGVAEMDRAMGMLPAGESLWRGHLARSLGAWKAVRGRTIATLRHSETLTAAALSPDGRRVLLGDDAGATILWDPGAGTVRALEGTGTGSIQGVAFDRAGTRCASGSSGGTLAVWDARTGRRVSGAQIGYHVTCVSLLGDGGMLVAGVAAPGRSVQLWETAEAEARGVPFEGGGIVTPKQLVGAPGGDKFLSISPQGECLLWDARTGARLANLSQLAGHVVTAAAVSADGCRVALAGHEVWASTVSADGSQVAARPALTMLDVGPGTTRRLDAGHWRQAMAVAFREDGGLVLVVDTGREVVMRRLTEEPGAWDDVPTDKPGPLPPVVSLADREILLSGLQTNVIHLAEAPALDLRHVPLGEGLTSARAAVSADGMRIATMTLPRVPLELTDRAASGQLTQAERDSLRRTMLRIWDGRTLQPLSQETSPPGGLVAGCIAMSPTSDAIAVGCSVSDAMGGMAPVFLGTLRDDGSFRFAQVGVHAGDVTAVAFTPDGERLLSGSFFRTRDQPGELVCWDLSGGYVWRRPYEATVKAIAVSADGARVAVGSTVSGSDGALRIHAMGRPWDQSDPIAVGKNVTATTFSGDGRRVAVSDMAGLVLVLDVAGSAPAPLAWLQHPDGRAMTLAFGPGDDVLYAGVLGQEGGVYAWDARVWKRIDPVTRIPGGVTSLGLVSRGQAVVVVTTSGRMVRRALPTLGAPGRP